ncbi:MAG: 5-dehydro-2-deoxygluconokinase [Pseudomonadota bacterium]
MNLSAHIADGIARNRFLVIGRVGIDFTPTPPGVKTEDAETMWVAMGGSAANTAAGIVKLGGAAALATCVSDDSIGRYCVNQLKRYGVDSTHVRAVGGEYRNSLAVYETRITEHQSVIYRNGAADFAFSREDVDAIDFSAYGAVLSAGTVFAAEPSRDATFYAFKKARAAGLPILFDIDYRPYSWPSPQEAADVLSRAGAMSDAIIGNDEEFGFMAGGIDKGLDKARSLAATTAGLVIYKMGPEGAVTFAGGEEMRTGVYPAKALKPTGAGDSFLAGLMASLAAGLPLREAVLRGSACAAIVVAKPGCAPAMPDTAQLEDFLAKNPAPPEA